MEYYKQTEVPIEDSRLGYEPILCQDFLARADPRRAIFDSHPHQQRIFRHMKHAIITLGKHDDQVPGLLEELATPALPADWLAPCGFWLTREPIGREQREHQPREDHMHPLAHRHIFASRGLRLGVLGHGHVRFCRHDTGETLRVQPPEVCAIPKALINDDFVPPGVASQMGPGLRDQRPSPMALMLPNLPHLDGQRDLGGRIDQEKHFQPYTVTSMSCIRPR